MPVCDKCTEDEEILPEHAEGLIRVVTLLRNNPRVQRLARESINDVRNEIYGYHASHQAKPSSRQVYSSRLGVLSPVYDAEGKVIAHPTLR